MTPQPEPKQLAAARWHRKSDDRLIQTIGTFPLIAAAEIAEREQRDIVQLRRRLRQLALCGLMDRIQGSDERVTYFEEIKFGRCENVIQIPRFAGEWKPRPHFWFLKPKALNGDHDLIAWERKATSQVDHDRGINLIHLALDHFFPAELQDWQQNRNTLKITVGGTTFIPDGRFSLGDSFYLEYTHATPSGSDLYDKVPLYNDFLKGVRGTKVLFVFTDQKQALNFLSRVSDNFPYRWLWATDIESLKHNPTGKIFWCPKDFEERTYGFSDIMV